MLVRVDLSTRKYPQACIGFTSRTLLIRYFKYCLSFFGSVQRRVSSNSLLKLSMHSEHLPIEFVIEINQIKLHESCKINPKSCKTLNKVKVKKGIVEKNK